MRWGGATARQHYRVYLYVVGIALLIFGAVSAGLLLATLLIFTPLRGTFRTAPESSEPVQRVVFALVAWLIVIVLGGLHYRLIRREIASHPAAAGSGIRAFFLNITGGLAVLITGLASIPLAIRVLLRRPDAGLSAPRRGYLLALLAGGAVTPTRLQCALVPLCPVAPLIALRCPR